jgi:serine/threonine-protein kinase
LYATLSGTMPPRDGGSNVCKDIRDHCPHVSLTLGKVVRKAVASSPRDRYKSAHELSRALANIKRGKRDFSECVPHRGHERCWIGKGVSSARQVTVCMLAVGRRVEIIPRYGTDGRRITALVRTVARAESEKALRSIFDSLS